MAWSDPVIDYCERRGHAFWAEPLNALTNIAFLLAAAGAFALWRRHGGRDVAALALIGVTALVGVGSFVFHTLATRGADVARRHSHRAVYLRLFFAGAAPVFLPRRARFRWSDAVVRGGVICRARVVSWIARLGRLSAGARRDRRFRGGAMATRSANGAPPRAGRAGLFDFANAAHRRRRCLRGVSLWRAFFLAFAKRGRAVAAAARRDTRRVRANRIYATPSAKASVPTAACEKISGQILRVMR